MSSPQTSRAELRWLSVSLPQGSDISFKVPQCRGKTSLKPRHSPHCGTRNTFKLDVRRPAERACGPPVPRPGWTLRNPASQGGGGSVRQGGWGEPIFRPATARSEPAAEPLEGELERTGGRAPTHVWSRFGTDGWRMTSKARFWTWRAATATAFESSSHFYQDFMVHLGVFFFIYLFLFPATPGVRFGRWRCGSCRSPLDVGIYGTCIFMSAWWYSTWQLLILVPLISEKFCTEKPPPGVFYLSTYILIQSICLCSHLVENLIEQMGVT